MKTINISVARHLNYENIPRIYHELAKDTFKSLDTTFVIDEIPWDELWHFAHTKAITKTGFDVSEVGNTWLGSLADADSLRVIPETFIRETDAPQMISEVAWKGIGPRKENGVVSWPFMVDIRMIYYWRDHLSRAGIDETDAFSSPERIHETLAKLRAVGLPGWGAPTFHNNNTLYNISSWVWSTGKDYLAQDGKRTQFCDDSVLESMAAYFRLARYMNGPFNTEVDLIRAFSEKRISVMMSGPWLWNELFHERLPAVDLSNVAVAMPPGPPFLGGSTLVIWNHANPDIVDEALAFFTLLTSFKPQATLFEIKGLLPVNQGVLKRPPFTSDANFKRMTELVEKGRYLSPSPIWGHLESSLIRVFGLVWAALKENGYNMSLDLLRRHLEPLAKRFDRMADMF